MNSEELNKMAQSIPENYPQIRSVIIVRHGYNIFEKYYQGSTPYSFQEICSDTKSITGALVGIAIDKGYIKSVDQKAIEFFPEYATDDLDPKVKQINIKNLLTQTSGFSWDEIMSDFQYLQYHHSKDWIKYAFNLSIANKPGKSFNYNSAAVHILSGLVNKASHLKRSLFSDRYLFGPLGIYRHVWLTDPQGNPFGGAIMYLKSRDMAKFGYMYLNNGSWNGSQIISSKWIEASTQAYSDGGLPEGEKYGYLFWITETNGHKAYFAGGFGGQFIYMIPDLDMVVVITSNSERPHTENRNIILDYIIPSITS